MRDLKEFFHVYDWSVYPDEVSDAALQYRTIADRAGPHVARAGSRPTRRPRSPPSSRCRCRTMMDGSRARCCGCCATRRCTGKCREGAVRAAAHEDINLLTVLPASDEAGLELLDVNGNWYPGAVRPGFAGGQRRRDARPGERRLLPGHHASGRQPDRRGGAAATHVAAAVPAPRRRRRARRRPHRHEFLHQRIAELRSQG